MQATVFTHDRLDLATGRTKLKLAADAFEDLKTGPDTRRLPLPMSDDASLDLELRRFSVTLPQTQFLSADPAGLLPLPAPDVVAWRGAVANEPGSHAFLSISSGGMVNGYVTRASGERYFLATPTGAVASGGPVFLSPERATPGLFADTPACGVGHEHDLRTVSRAPGAAALGGNAGRSPRMLFVAIDSDQQFYNLFNDTTAAQSYIVQVVAAVSDIYMRDFDAKLVLTFSRVWPNGGEPFTAHDLEGFADYWIFNEDPSPYHLIHLMSGRRDTSYGGVAYVAGSCSGSAYGISAFLLGSFPNPVGAPDLWNWDVVVVAHEMGHNMGTFHTHDGYNPPIDQCANGIWSRGEIMSYCHTVAGGLLNTDLRFTSRVQDVVRGDLELNNCQFFDCNNNGANDGLDVAEGFSPDTNGNQIPDECEDCNSNGTLDPAEIAGGAPDLNGNGIPDSCEADCNANGRPDAYDISNYGVADANLNRVPDSCEPDCDSDGTSDYVEIANSSGTLDLDRNSVHDACQDCNANGVSDWIDLLRPGNIYIADLGDFVREFHAASGAAVATHAGGSLLDPADVAFGPDRFLYIADRGNNRILKVNPETSSSTVFIDSSAVGLFNPTGLAFGPNGNLFASSFTGDSVLEINGQTGAFVRNFVTAGSGGLDTPYGLEFGPNGNLFVAGGNRVNEYHGSTGAFIRNNIAPGAGLLDARGLAVLPNGRVLVVSRGTNQILAADSNAVFLGQFNDEYPLAGLWGIAVGPNGNVFVTRISGGVRIIEYAADTGRYLRSFIRGDSQLIQPTGLAFRPESPVDCNDNTILDVCDITNGLEEDANGNNIPDACEAECTPALPVSAEAGGQSKQRYLSFDLSGSGVPLRALKVTLVDLPPPFEAFEGQIRWVGPPQDRPEGPVGLTFKAAQLQCEPYYADWSGISLLSVYSESIVPDATYEVRVLSDTCDPGQQSSYSAPLALITTPVWCDVVAPRNPPSGSVQPDFTDVSAFVDKFRNAPTAVTMAEIDVNPSLPNQDLNFSDVSDAVDSFRGLPYPNSGPVPCP